MSLSHFPQKVNYFKNMTASFLVPKYFAHWRQCRKARKCSCCSKYLFPISLCIFNAYYSKYVPTGTSFYWLKPIHVFSMGPTGINVSSILFWNLTFNLKIPWECWMLWCGIFMLVWVFFILYKRVWQIFSSIESSSCALFVYDTVHCLVQVYVT